MNQQDLRVMKTQQNIKDTFLHLLKEKSFDEISVKDICEQALISRSTFYSHYEDKYALLGELFDQVVGQFTQLAMNYFGDIETDKKKDGGRQMLQYIVENADIFQMFLKLNANNLDLYEKLNKIVYNYCYDYLCRRDREDKYNLGYEYISQVYTSIIMVSIRYLVDKKRPESFDGIVDLSMDINKYFFTKMI